jgi:hypothetical protein
MKKSIISTLTMGLLLLIGTSSAICADVSGVVTDSQGRGVGGIGIAARDSAGKIVSQAVTDSNGHYAISGLSPDAYDYVLKPLATGFKGGDAVSYLDSKGLTINWKVSDATDAIAMAAQDGPQQIAGDPFGMSMGEFASVIGLGTAGVAAGVVGGYGAAGGFSGGSDHPTSSSM